MSFYQALLTSLIASVLATALIQLLTPRPQPAAAVHAAYRCPCGRVFV